ncbi:MAG TPA: hypothetical protein VF631_05235 [Allosphingosinicella sp.]|jgi:hypothetical protein|uniref:hypothetical protein n=1 Tax=Allosphingosinicella sp. TaxID=2823234 RepID=UPI002F2844B5
MATRAIEPAALDLMLSAIPSLPRPVLARLTARLIDHMDEMEPDPDVEANGDELDGTPTADDPIFPASGERGFDFLGAAGDPDDAEDDDPDSSVEDDPRGFDPEQDFGADDVGEDCQGGDVCDDTRPIADVQAYREHRARLQRERCYKLRRVAVGPDGYIARRLWIEPNVPSKRNILRRKRGMPRSPRA